MFLTGTSSGSHNQAHRAHCSIQWSANQTSNGFRFITRTSITLFGCDWSKGPKQSLMCSKWQVSSFLGRKELPFQLFHCARMGAEGKIIPFHFCSSWKKKKQQKNNNNNNTQKTPNIIFNMISVSLIVFNWIEMWSLKVSNPHNELTHTLKLSWRISLKLKKPDTQLDTYSLLLEGRIFQVYIKTLSDIFCRGPRKVSISEEEKQSRGELAVCKFLIEIYLSRISDVSVAKAATHEEKCSYSWSRLTI